MTTPLWKQKYSRYLTPFVLGNRHNKTALGMSYTAARSGHRLPMTGDALTLAVNGTLEKHRSLMYLTTRKQEKCPCCGSRQGGKLRLNDKGRQALYYARKRKERRIKQAETGL